MSARENQHSLCVADGLTALIPVVASLRQRGAVLLYAHAGMGLRERPAVSISAHPRRLTNWLRDKGAEKVWCGVGKAGPQAMYRCTLEGVDVEWMEPA